jgi:hypothetical protein
MVQKGVHGLMVVKGVAAAHFLNFGSKAANSPVQASTTLGCAFRLSSATSRS